MAFWVYPKCVLNGGVDRERKVMVLRHLEGMYRVVYVGHLDKLHKYVHIHRLGVCMCSALERMFFLQLSRGERENFVNKSNQNTNRPWD